MAIKNKIGVYTTEEGEVRVQMSGNREDLLAVLAVLNAKFLLEATSSVEEYRRAFERLQVETGNKYLMLKTDEYKRKKSTDGEDFLDMIIE